MQSDAGEKFEEKEGRLFMSTQHVTRQKARREEEIGEESDLAWYVFHFQNGSLLGTARNEPLRDAAN